MDNKDRKEAIIKAALSERKKPVFRLFKLEGTKSPSIKVIRDLLIEVFYLKPRNLGGIYYCPEQKAWMFMAMPEEINLNPVEGIKISKWSFDDLEKSPKLFMRYANAIGANKMENGTIRQLAKS